MPLLPYSCSNYFCRVNIPRRGKQVSQEPGREYVVGLIWDAVREQTLIQLIQKVILSPLKSWSPARPGRPERNHNHGRGGTGEERGAAKPTTPRKAREYSRRRTVKTETRNFPSRGFRLSARGSLVPLDSARGN